MEEKEFINPRNSAGEYLYYEKEHIFDPSVEGMAFESGFCDGIPSVAMNEK